MISGSRATTNLPWKANGALGGSSRLPGPKGTPAGATQSELPVASIQALASSRSSRPFPGTITLPIRSSQNDSAIFQVIVPSSSTPKNLSFSLFPGAIIGLKAPSNGSCSSDQANITFGVKKKCGFNSSVLQPLK